MQPPPEYRPPSVIDTANVLSFVVWLVVHSYASVIYAFTRRRFGKNYFGMFECAGLFAPLIVITFVDPSTGPTLLPYVSNVYLVLMLWHRLLSPSPSSSQLHSKYNGYPRLCYLIPLDEMIFKKGLEPLLVGLAGIGVFQLDVGIGLFLIFGGVAELVDYGYIEAEFERKIKRITDAEIEDAFLMDELDRRRP